LIFKLFIRFNEETSAQETEPPKEQGQGSDMLSGLKGFVEKLPIPPEILKFAMPMILSYFGSMFGGMGSLVGGLAGFVLGNTSPAEASTTNQTSSSEAKTSTNLESINKAHAFPESWNGKLFSRLNLPAGSKKVALTFDDGPSEFTGQVLDALKEGGAKATFFILGENLMKDDGVTVDPTKAALLKRIVDEGHTLANHTFSHKKPDSDRSTKSQPTGELTKTRKLIKEITGVDTNLFRPPYGELTDGYQDEARKLGYASALWSKDSNDWQELPPEKALANIGNYTKGDVILFHDSTSKQERKEEGGLDRSNTVLAVKKLLSQNNGKYEFTTLQDMMREAAK
jgi:peptidoglycan/xylan/chitin deacetylase (PgdA/CDA1 family)